MAFTGAAFANLLIRRTHSSRALLCIDIDRLRGTNRQAIASNRRRTSRNSQRQETTVRRFAGLLQQVRETTDIPELFFRPCFAELRPREAQRLGCYVLVGLPTVDSEACGTDRRPIYHNSLLVVGPDGAHVHTYHKTFLYGELTNDRADYLWAEAGTGFVSLDLPFPSSSPFHAVAAADSASSDLATRTFRLVPAICMDLNMPTFDAPFDKFELATFASEKRADIVVGSMAWLDSEPPMDSAEDESRPNDSREGEKVVAATQWEEVRSVISYWVLRLSPLIGSGAAFICANRVGREGGKRHLPLLTECAQVRLK